MERKSAYSQYHANRNTVKMLIPKDSDPSKVQKWGHLDSVCIK